MNFIFVSPHFPARYYKWTEALAERGVNVLAIVDAPYESLSDRLKRSVREVYYVHDMNNFDAMVEAVAYFQNKYGKIDYLESMNEWWLRSDAKLREKFGIEGLKPSQMDAITAKSDMKAYFEKGGAKTIRYLLVKGPKDKKKAAEFVKEVGFPVFVKPNVGVGAASSYSLKNQAQFDEFFAKELPETYIMEEFIDGYIVSFDGICNDKSEVVFATTDHFPTPVAQIVLEKLDCCYYDAPFGLPMDDIDQKKFHELGKNVVKAFGIKKRFFHIEFFVLKKAKKGLGKKGDVIALECNMRAPGGATPDIINFGNSVSCYEIYADVICYNENRQPDYPEKFYCWATSRRDIYHYAHTHQEILEKFHDNLAMIGRYPDHLADDMGNDYYFGKFKTKEEGQAFEDFIVEKAA